MATYRKRGTQWEVQIRRRGWPTHTRTFRVKADAQAWAGEIEATMHQGVFKDTSLLRETTVRTILQRYLKAEVPQKKGAESESYRLNVFMRYPFADLTLGEVGAHVFAQWRDMRLQQVKGPTVTRELNLLSHVFSIARTEWKYPVVNPLADVRRPPENPSRTRIPDWSETKHLLRKLTPTRRGERTGGAARNPWLKPLVCLALRTAMRRGELVALTWENVHLKGRYLHIPNSKNNSSRDIPLSKKSILILSRLPRHESGRVFPLSANAVKLAVKRAIDRASVEDMRFHDLRHAAITRLATKLSNVLELSAVTGHKGLAMLKRYYHPKPAGLADKLDS